MQTIRPFRSVLIYLGAAILCVGFLVFVLDLWRVNLQIPLQNEGDAIVSQVWVQNLLETGWYAYSNRAGAPHGMNLNDWPAAEGLHFALIGVIALLGGNTYWVINVFYLATFVLSTCIMLFVLRRLEVGYLPALVGGVLFAFLPYHLWRGQHHLFLSGYYLLPLPLLVTIWLMRGELNKSTGRWILALVVAALTSSIGTYYAFFGCFFFLLGGVTQACRARTFRPLFSTAVLIAVVCGGLALNVAPWAWHRLAEGENELVARRNPAEADVFGLNLSQLVLPRTNHRIRYLAEVKRRYDTTPGRPLVNDFGSSMGLLGVIGLVGAGLSLLARGNGAKESDLLADIGLLAVCGMLLATIGGGGSLFATYVSPQVRCYDRVSVYIAFLGLAAFAILLDRMIKASTSLPARGFAGVVCVGLLLFGVWEQTSKADVPSHARNLKEYQAMADFTAAIEKQIPPNGMIFQLPFSEFPERGPIGAMNCYDHFRLLMHSPTLRVSHGAVRGRPAGNQMAQLAKLPVEELVEELVLRGYAGIHLDRYGFPEGPGHLREYEQRLGSLLGVDPIVSATGRDIFFPLKSFSERLQASLPAAEWEKRVWAAQTPIGVNWEPPFDEEERSPTDHWRWCTGAVGQLTVENWSDKKAPVSVQLMFCAPSGGASTVKVSGLAEAQVHLENGASGPCSFKLQVPPGKHRLRFQSDAPVFNDGRTIHFGVRNPVVHLESPEPPTQ